MQEFHVKKDWLRLQDSFNGWIKLTFGGWRLDGKLQLAVKGIMTMQRLNMQEVGNKLEIIWEKIRSRSYTDKGQDWGKLFRYYDRDSSGFISIDEFRYAVRKDCGIGQDLVSNKDIKDLFATVADAATNKLHIVGNTHGKAAHSLGINYSEFRHFLALSGARDIMDLDTAKQLNKFDANTAKEIEDLEAKKALELADALAAAAGDADAEEKARIAFERTKKLALGRLKSQHARQRDAMRHEQQLAVVGFADDKEEFYRR